MADERIPEDLTGADLPRQRGSVVTEELDGEAVVYAEETGALHVLNATATLVWQHLDGQVSIDELAAALSGASGAPAELVHADVLQTVRSFGSLGLLDGIRGTDADEVADPEESPQGQDVSLGHDLRFLPEPPHG